MSEWLLQKQFALLQRHLGALPADRRALAQSAFTERLLARPYVIETPAGPLSFVLIGRTAAGRARTVLTKQPATIRWIDGFRAGSVFWDIGANVGVYALYAALRGNARVVAFEPAAINYFLLTANCEANHLEERIDSLLMGVGAGHAMGHLEVSQFASAKSFSFRSRATRPPSRQAALIVSIDHLVETFCLPPPDYIKIDAPGMSEAIIGGGLNTLRSGTVREIHMELRESKAGHRIIAMLEQCGFAVAARDWHGGSCDVTFTRAGPP